MPRFYPSQEIIDNKLASKLYDGYRNNDNSIFNIEIKNRKDFIELSKALKLLIDCPDGMSSEKKTRVDALNHLEKIREKYNKEEYPELWI